MPAATMVWPQIFVQKIEKEELTARPDRQNQ
jgi:hypothetical protein